MEVMFVKHGCIYITRTQCSATLINIVVIECVYTSASWKFCLMLAVGIQPVLNRRYNLEYTRVIKRSIVLKNISRTFETYKKRTKNPHLAFTVLETLSRIPRKRKEMLSNQRSRIRFPPRSSKIFSTLREQHFNKISILEYLQTQTLQSHSAVSFRYDL